MNLPVSDNVHTVVLNTEREVFTPRVRFQRTARRKNFDEKGGLLDLRSRRPRTALATLARMLVLNPSSIFSTLFLSRVGRFEAKPDL